MMHLQHARESIVLTLSDVIVQDFPRRPTEMSGKNHTARIADIIKDITDKSYF